MIRVVALAGLAGSGKSTVASYLVTQGYTLVKFAKPLKDMLRSLGMTDEELEGSLKEVPCSRFGNKTPRFIMQTLGTEWGRNLIDQSIWTSAWRRKVVEVLEAGGKVICDDCRFENEWMVLKDVEGLLINLNRTGSGVMDGSGNHPSEKGGLPADYYVHNDFSLENLYNKINKILAKKIH